MICHWCKGTYKECGCGLGHCAHCNNGETADPPFGPAPDSHELDILSKANFEEIIEFGERDIHEQIEFVSIHLEGKQLLTVDELDALKSYWDNDYRDETLGDVLNRAAWLVKQKLKT